MKIIIGFEKIWSNNILYIPFKNIIEIDYNNRINYSFSTNEYKSYKYRLKPYIKIMCK